MIMKSKYSIHERINLKLLKGTFLIWANLPNKLKQVNSYGVPGSDWDEPVEYLTFSRESNACKQDLIRYDIPWEADNWSIRPALGYYCDGKQWVKIDGYEEPNFSPGRTFRSESLPPFILNMVKSSRPAFHFCK